MWVDLIVKIDVEKMDMLVLVFCGIEFKCLVDLRIDFNLVMIMVKGDIDEELWVYFGFFNVFLLVCDMINEVVWVYLDLLVFVIGYSLGGVLVVVVMCYIVNWLEGVCYMFGVLCIGNEMFFD